MRPKCRAFRESEIIKQYCFSRRTNSKNMYSSFPKERDINYMKSNNMPTDHLHIIFLKNAFMSILKDMVACACACYFSAMDIPPDPNQPKTFKFPQCSFGVKNKKKKTHTKKRKKISKKKQKNKKKKQEKK